MADGQYLMVRRPMPELHFAYSRDGAEAVIILDPDSPDNMTRNLGALPPGTRRLLIALLETALVAAREVDADG
jgi:hypothetical protein